MNIALKCLVLSCLTLFSVAAADDHNRRSQFFLMFTAGTLNVGVVQEQINLPPPDNRKTISIIDEVSFGSLGRATLKTVAKVIIDENGFPVPAENCGDGFGIKTNDAIVLTFKNLSQLVGTSETTVCFLPNGEQAILGKGHWVSGTHRFANVTGGEFHLKSTATPLPNNGQFYSTAGSLSGIIKRRR